MTYTIRRAVPTDASTVLMFIKELGSYEKLEHQITATIHDVKKTLFCDQPKAEVLIAEVEEKPAGFALFFIITQRFYVNTDSISKIFTCAKNTAVLVLEKRYCEKFVPLQSSGIVVVWNGGV